MDQPEYPKDPYAALRIPEFRLYAAARMFVTISIQIMSVVVGWQMYEITKDPLSLGLIGLAEAISAIGVALFAGYMADKFNRKTIIQSVLILLTLCAIGLYFVSIDYFPAFIGSKTICIYCILFFTGIARGFLGPAIFAIMPQLLPDRKHYNNAVTWNSSIWHTAAVAGPAIGGLAYGILNASQTYLIVIGLLLVATFLFIFISKKPVPESDAKQSVFDNLSEGLRFVFGKQVILSAISLDLFAVLFGGAVALLPVFADEILHIGPTGLGLLRAAPALGAVLTAIAIAHFPLKDKAGIKMLYCVAGFGLCMILFALSQNFWFSLFILVLSGMFDNISVITRHTLIHNLTPENMKGRVAAVNNIFIGSSNEIGAFESGVTAKAFGLIPSVVLGGILTIFVVAVTGWKAEKLKTLSFEDN